MSRRGEKERILLAALRKAHGKHGSHLGSRPVSLNAEQASPAMLPCSVQVCQTGRMRGGACCIEQRAASMADNTGFQAYVPGCRICQPTIIQKVRLPRVLDTQANRAATPLDWESVLSCTLRSSSSGRMSQGSGACPGWWLAGGDPLRW